MDSHIWLELFGYFGSVVIAISLMMRSLLRLRMVNTVGSLVFVAYGILIHAYPVAFLNGVIVLINAFYLVQMVRQKDYFQLMEVSPDGNYLNGFLDFYKEDIQEIFPDFFHEVRENRHAYLLLRNMVPAGVLLLHLNDSQGEIAVDYVIPAYRDFRIARFLFHEQAAYFQSQGLDRFTAAPGSPRHSRYLERMGFRLLNGKYTFDLAAGKTGK